MLELHKQLASARTDHEKTALQRQIEAVVIGSRKGRPSVVRNNAKNAKGVRGGGDGLGDGSPARGDGVAGGDDVGTSQATRLRPHRS